MTHNGVQTLQRRPFIFICSYKPWVLLVAKTLDVDVTGNAVRACRCSSSLVVVVVVVSFFSPQRVARWPFDTFHTHGKIVERRAMKRTDHHDPDPTSKVGRNSPSPLGHPGAPTKSKTAEAQGLDGSTTAQRRLATSARSRSPLRRATTTTTLIQQQKKVASALAPRTHEVKIGSATRA